MWLSQHCANTIQPTDYTTSNSMFAFDKPLPATPSTELGTDDTYIHIATSKQLPAHPQSTFAIDQEPIIIAVIGHGLIGKTSLIRQGFLHYLSYQYQDITVGENIGLQQHSYMVEINNESTPRPVILLEMDHSLKDDDLTTSVHAALICYDVTQQVSMTGVPDLLSLYHSQQLPIYLLGLNSDSASTRQVDFTLGEQIAQHFRVEFYEMKTNDALTIHHMFMNLLRKCANAPITINHRTNSSQPPVIRQPPPATTNSDDDTKGTPSTTMAEVVNQHPAENNHHHDKHQVRHLHLDNEPISTPELHAAIPADDPSCPSVGFVYAPTTTTDTAAPPSFDPPHDVFLSSCSRKTSTDNLARFRRGSKDSGDSLGTGMSVDAIIDRLITPGMGRCDDSMIPIFVIFFRKFMSPYELIQVLIKRFENDLCMPSLPTPLQQRITCVLIAWMTDYWCDFYHRQTRNQLHLFLGRLSALILSTTSSSSFQPLLEKLYPLSLQPTPDFDPDDTWGRKDMDSVAIDHSKKKDSGYISSYLGASYSSLVPESSASDMSLSDCVWSRRPSATGMPSPPPPHPSTKLCASSSLLNTSVTPDYFNGFPTSRIPMAPAAASSPPSPPTTHSGSTTPASLTKSNDSSHKTTINITNKRIRNTTPPESLTRPEFAGGLMHHMSYKPSDGSTRSVMAPSGRPYDSTGLASADTDIYGRTASAASMHQQTNQSLLTTSQPTMSDPASIKINTKLLLSLSNQEMAEQLTWIEAELFGKIKSREFIRMIWANAKQPQTRPNSMASISSEEQEDLHSLDQAATTSLKTKSGLLASISHFNFISAWVISMIVTQPKLGKRVALLEKFMTIAVALRDLNNYNSLMAILAGVNNAAILRMKHTQEAIKKKKIYKRFQSLEKLMSSDRSYSSYRMALKAHGSCPSIPYLGIHSQDLIALDEANKDVKADGTIHWDKFRLMGECIMIIIKLQQQEPKHNVMPNQTILNWIANCGVLTEEEQYTQSILIEPRLKTKSMTRLRDLWFRN